MNRCLHVLFIGLLLATSVQCTGTRWMVVDNKAVNEREAPRHQTTHFRILPSDSVTASRPFLTLDLYQISEKTVNQRVLAERTIQQYRPRWGFMAAGLLGSAVAFYAANSGDLHLSSGQNSTMLLNAAGGVLAGVALMHQKPVGEPIRTGEMAWLRRSGVTTRSDTLQGQPVDTPLLPVEIEISREGELLLTRSWNAADEPRSAIRLSTLLEGVPPSGPDPGVLEITLTQAGEVMDFEIPVQQFMVPVVVVTAPAAELRSAPVYDEQVIVNEVAGESELIYEGQSTTGWMDVAVEGDTLFIAEQSGEIRWREAEQITTPRVTLVEEPVFGEIDVEFAVPVLRPVGEPARGLIIGNHRNNQLGSRRYIGRDFRLTDLYFREALSIPAEEVHLHSLMDPDSHDQLEAQLAEEQGGLTMLYLSGFARPAEETDGIELIHLAQSGEESTIQISELLTDLAHSSETLVVMLDLEFHHELADIPASNGSGLYRTLADQVTAINENTALVFSSRPDQSPGIYEGLREESRYHHIFPYYLARGLQLRHTRLADLVDFLQSQVDYTSRRLRDRPQSVQAYGDLSINLSE